MAILTATQVKTYLGVPHSDDDAWFTAEIDRAQAVLEDELGGRSLVNASRVEVLDGDATVLFVKHRPIAADPAVVVKDEGTAIDTSLYDVYPEAGMIRGAFAAGARRWTIEYDGPDWASLPKALEEIALEYIAWKYQNRVPGNVRESDGDQMIWTDQSKQDGNGLPLSIRRKLAKWKSAI